MPRLAYYIRITRTQLNGVEASPIDIKYLYDRTDIEITDYRIGTNKVYLFGYKDGEVISEAFVEYTVTKPKDVFLNIEWNSTSMDQSYYYMTGYTPRIYLPTEKALLKLGDVCLII